MTETELNAAVSRATGENITTIERIGFRVEGPNSARHDRAFDARVVDDDTSLNDSDSPIPAN